MARSVHFHALVASLALIGMVLVFQLQDDDILRHGHGHRKLGLVDPKTVMPKQQQSDDPASASPLLLFDAPHETQCPFVMDADFNTETAFLEQKEGKTDSFPPFVIHNIGKSGSHFLTQTLTSLGLPVSFEYGLRLNMNAAKKSAHAAEIYKKGEAYGFSGADFAYGDGGGQWAIKGERTDWTGIVNSLAALSPVDSTVKHVVLVRTNLISRALGSPAGDLRGKVAHFTVDDIKDGEITFDAMKTAEIRNAGVIQHACGSALALSQSGKANIFVINYESLLIDPFTWFNELLMFLGGNSVDEGTILHAVENGKFKKKHASTLYADVGFQDIADNLFVGDPIEVDQSIKDCFLHQALAPFPREETFCFHQCFVPSGLYACPPS